ncbi:hypothetical protein P6 [Wheat yellow striate virus]|uniref:Uncharacterized protein n=1 Tax=Wheat yellow striate virus TaxID=2152660 RepID=A0A2R4K2H0_9RHAB|nr:hypothetical protein P6 [Wheat yellow striate virus]AVV48074.1 hypothetical protein P6 [Wheat yellow striate virus]
MDKSLDNKQGDLLKMSKPTADTGSPDTPHPEPAHTPEGDTTQKEDTKGNTGKEEAAQSPEAEQEDDTQPEWCCEIEELDVESDWEFCYREEDFDCYFDNVWVYELIDECNGWRE